MRIDRKLSGVLEGALAAGGDPATSPLYVFGPFLRLIVPAGVAGITFGASVWLAVLTVVTVSAVYRLVMQWVPDGTGGSGLTEDELGAWAGKINAGITLTEYTLTFLVSMSALVTFLADRFPGVNTSTGLGPVRTLLAVALSAITAALVNRGPRAVTLTFGPATAGVLLLLWTLIAATIWQTGLHLPPLHAAAFTGPHLSFTLGGYVRILALMTGIEVFANLVSAYSGTPPERSRKAFGSLVVVMGTTSATMLVVGPAILALSDPARTGVSVFTQTMDALLPGPLAYGGTLVGVAVLLSACATAAQGIQYLTLGLSHRRYVPVRFGLLNRFGVAALPVWTTLSVATLCFAVFGTREETYLALYAAGVFVLLTMTAWAATKRLARDKNERRNLRHATLRAGVVVGAALTSGATVTIFWERLLAGAWVYFVIVPVLFACMTVVRRSRGEPTPLEDCLGRCLACSCPSLGTACAAENARRRLGEVER